MFLLQILLTINCLINDFTRMDDLFVHHCTIFAEWKALWSHLLSVILHSPFRLSRNINPIFLRSFYRTAVNKIVFLKVEKLQDKVAIQENEMEEFKSDINDLIRSLLSSENEATNGNNTYTVLRRP